MKVIEIERTREVGERAWRAVVRLPKGLAVAGYGVSGAMTEEGPWVEGYGCSPEGALQAAHITIGKAVTGALYVTELGRLALRIYAALYS